MVSDILELSFTISIKLVLLDKLLDIADWLLKFPYSVLQPFLVLVVNFTHMNWDQFAQLIEVCLWGGLDLRSGALGVQLDKTDIGC